MILAIDCGNSRLKWGLYRDGRWQGTGAVPLTDFARLEGRWKGLAAVDKIIVANVAGPEVRKKLEQIFRRRSCAAVWVRAKRRACGITNNYRQAERLGADRWAALIGAWSLLRGPCLVVGAGTATTADILRGDGTFAGGVIVPGLQMMKRSLASETARLSFVKGRFSRMPRNTRDAIETGCIMAQAGVIERVFRMTEPGTVCLLAGGAAERIARHLSIPVRRVDNLVLEGLVRIAVDSR
jgi:type III pantothenate kinase